MPHDRNGREVKVGDRVTVPCIVRSVSPSPDFCNCTLETVETMRGSVVPGGTTITLNVGQVELAEAMAERDPPDGE